MIDADLGNADLFVCPANIRVTSIRGSLPACQTRGRDALNDLALEDRVKDQGGR